MKLTPEDHAKLQTKQLANIIRKLNEGKTLTAREEAILAREKASSSPGVQTSEHSPLPSGFAKTWDDLAKALGVSRKSVQNWRGRPELVAKLPTPRADGRHDIAAWARAMVDHQLARADEDVELDELSQERRTVTDWKMYREQLMCTRIERDMKKEDGILLVATELEIPLGATFAAIQNKLTQFPARVARFLVGFRDEQELEEKLREEIDADLSDLHGAEYVNLTVGEILAELPFDDATEHLFSLVTFEGQDRQQLMELIGTVAMEALKRIGGRALQAARPQRLAGQDIPDAITGQVAAGAAGFEAAKRNASETCGASAASVPVPPARESGTKSGKTSGETAAAAPAARKRGRPRKARPQPAAPPGEIEAAILKDDRRGGRR